MRNFNRDRGNRNRDRRGGGGFGRRDSGRGFNRGGDRQMHKVICDDCHKECEVPFKPSSDKPIYCDQCFAKHGGGKSNERRGDNRSNFGNRESNKSHEEIMKAIKDLKYKIDELTKLFNSKTPDDKEVVAKTKVTKKTTAVKKKPTAKKKTTKKKK